MVVSHCIAAEGVPLAHASQIDITVHLAFVSGTQPQECVGVGPQRVSEEGPFVKVKRLDSTILNILRMQAYGPALTLALRGKIRCSSLGRLPVPRRAVVRSDLSLMHNVGKDGQIIFGCGCIPCG